MAKQIYIDENGNPIEVSGTINNASMLPISANDSTDTKTYIDTGLSGKADSSDTYTKAEVGTLVSNSVYPKGTLGSGTDCNSLTTSGIFRNNGNSTNFPTQWGTLIVFSPNTSLVGCTQIFITSGNVAYYRMCWDDANWQNWKQF